MNMMTGWDLFVTPIFITIVFSIGQVFRLSVKDKILRSYYLPAIRVKIVGAIALGIVYQFYYGGGDSFNFYRDGSIIWASFLDSPYIWLKIIFLPAGTYTPDTYFYTRNIYFFIAGDNDTYNIIRLVGLFAPLTLNTYSSTAVMFAVVSFSGVWAMYRVFYHLYPHLHRPLAYSIFFVPSVYFWGSGVMKDSICIGALGWFFYGFYFGWIVRDKIIQNTIIGFLGAYILYSIKEYILYSFIAGLMVWVFLQYRAQIRNRALRFMMLPVMLVAGVAASFFAVTGLTADNARYDLENIGNTAKASADWLEYVSKQQQGSAYSLGITDWSPAGILSKAPQAIWLALFQPHPWEARNPIMMLSAIEGVFFIWITLNLLLRNNPIKIINVILAHPILVLCLVFTFILGIGVAITSNNFGTLVRYRIPFQPFFVSMLYILRYQLQGTKKLW